MSIIKEIQIENFRSIRNARIQNLSSYEPIVGLNSAGKSNLLRALKAFFTGTVDEAGNPVDLQRDYCDYGPNKSRKISVGLLFTISDTLRFTRQRTFLEKHGIADTLAIEQSWSIDGQTRTTRRQLAFGHNLDNLDFADDSSDISNLDAFIRAIEFRYVPNHARPSELIDQYVSPLRRTLISRLRSTREYRTGDPSELLGAMARIADTLFSDVSDSVSRGLSGRTIRSDLPTDFAELAFDLAVRSVDSTGRARLPELEGSGTQQFMFLHLLDLADRTARSAGFGWLQGHVWAIEEPESFLHSRLRQQYAADLLHYSESSRRQVFATTHQDEFVRVGSSSIFAKPDQFGTSFERMASKRALHLSNRMVVTDYRHPLLQYPDRPLVFVEGKFDAGYLRQALKSTSIKPRWRIADPDDTTGSGTGGDAFKKYLQFNAAAINSRPDYAPIIVVRDWETRDADQYKKHLSGHEYSTVVTMPKDLANPLLGEGWAGIERYLPTEYIQHMIPTEDLLVRGDGVIQPEKNSLGKHKQALFNEFDITEHPAPNLVSLAKWIDSEVDDVLDQVPTESFL